MSFQSLVGNFALILFILLIITGVIWTLDLFVLSRQRQNKADIALKEFDSKTNPDSAARAMLQSKLLRQPLWIEYSGSFFPVIALVFVLRSFLFEPFKIPSGSMLPTLFVGDFILVNKFTYGIRLPIIDKKIISVNEPQRGDVMVFKYPKDMTQNYIKRIVGTPGDLVKYQNKKLTVNGIDASYVGQNDFLHAGIDLSYSKQFEERFSGIQHKILNDEGKSSAVNLYEPADFPFANQCTYDDAGFTCRVPAGHYFMMGDNRDNSQDSRYWGFVPDQNIVGKAFFIWMNTGDLKRVGSFK
jgi:signal peptidase I